MDPVVGSHALTVGTGGLPVANFEAEMTKLLLLLFSGWPGAMAFCPSPSSLVTSPRQSTTLRVVEVGPSDDDVEPAEPGQMRISEIKSELDLVGVYRDR